MEPSLIQAVFVDFDGTTFHHDSYEVPASTLLALSQLKEKGLKIGLLTNRTPEETIHIPKEFIELMDALLWSAGAVVVENGKTTSFNIDPRDVEIAIGYAREHQLVVRYSTGTEGYFDGTTQEIYTALFQRLYHIRPDVKAWDHEACVNLIIYCDDAQKVELSGILKHSQPTIMVRMVEVTPQGINKGTALIAQCQRWGIPPSASIAFGDGINDITMLQAAGIGIAMGNAHDDVKAAADRICGKIEDDGLYQCVKELGLL
ncbi:MAG: HAD-IIB family hydrolase [Erysipelotrichaceae bacterium]